MCHSQWYSYIDSDIELLELISGRGVIWRARNQGLPFDGQKLPVPLSKEKQGMLLLLSSCLIFEDILNLGNQAPTTSLEKARWTCQMSLYGAKPL